MFQILKFNLIGIIFGLVWDKNNLIKQELED